MVIDLKTYKQNKEIIKVLSNINSYFVNNFPYKTWGWCGLTALLFAQVAIEKYIEENEPNIEFYNALKSTLWDFQNMVNKKRTGKGGEQA